MSTLVLLARHGSHDEVGRVLSGRSDISLNAAGRMEAARLARGLQATPLAAIHTSPRRRARETAEIVGEAWGLSVTTVEALDEIDFGDWTGRAFAQLAGDPSWNEWNSARSTAQVRGGETMGAAVERAWAYLSSLADTQGPVLCVSHCDIIRGVIARCLGLSLDRLLTFDCEPASLSRLVIGEDGARVASVNERFG